VLAAFVCTCARAQMNAAVRVRSGVQALERVTPNSSDEPLKMPAAAEARCFDMHELGDAWYYGALWSKAGHTSLARIR